MSSSLRPISVAGVPALIAQPANVVAPLRTVLWFHGFRADALAHAAELERCAALGFLAVGIDAVGHGARSDPDLAERTTSAGGALPVMLELVDQTIDELPAFVDELVSMHGAHRRRISAVGISMGAFLVYRSIKAGILWRSSVALLGSPRFNGDAGSPHLALETFRRVALLSITAEHDENVPPGSVRRLHTELEEFAGSSSAHRHHELRGSGHLTSAAHWAEAMSETLDWLQRFA
jgi:uncharacterized protein